MKKLNINKVILKLTGIRGIKTMLYGEGNMSSVFELVNKFPITNEMHCNEYIRMGLLFFSIKLMK